MNLTTIIKKHSETIYKSIKQNRTENALDALEELVNEIGDDQFIKETILIYSSFNEFKSDYNKGVKNSRLEKNIVNDKIFSVLDNLKKIYSDNIVIKSEVEHTVSPNTFSLKERILNSKSIDILSYSCKGILDEYSHHITESILNGAKIRLIFVKEESEAFKLMLCNTRVESIKGDMSKTKKRIELIKNSIRRYKENFVENLSIKEITWIPSTNVFLFDVNETRAAASIKVNPIFYSTPMTERLEPFLIYKKDNPKIFEYYRIQYEHLWKYNDCSIPDFKSRIEYEGRKILKR